MVCGPVSGSSDPAFQETPTKGLRGARQVDVKHKRCVHDTCQKRPSFNFSGETRALYCGPHRLPGMVNVDQERRRVNRGAPPPQQMWLRELNPIPMCNVRCASHAWAESAVLRGMRQTSWAACMSGRAPRQR